MQLGNHRFQWSDIVNCVSVITGVFIFAALSFYFWACIFNTVFLIVHLRKYSSCQQRWYNFVSFGNLVILHGGLITECSEKKYFPRIYVCRHKSTNLPSLKYTFICEDRFFIPISTRWSGEGFPHSSHSCMTNGVPKPWPFMTWKG